MSYTINFQQLQDFFRNRLSNSKDRATLIKREIEHIENVLDSGAPPVSGYGDPYAIRRAYDKYIVAGHKLSKRYAPAAEGDEIALYSTGPQAPTADPLEFDFSKARKYKLIPPAESEVNALNIATALFDYLQWLRTLNQPDTSTTPENPLPEQLEQLSEQLERLQILNQPVTDELLIDPTTLGVIWRKYRHHFPSETLESWLHRFTRGAISLPPIKVEAAARQGTSKLILIAILAYIQNKAGSAFQFQQFVRTHFGIAAYQTLRTRSKDKKDFIDVHSQLNAIFKQFDVIG
jgi:hypothetical protein